MSSLFFKSDFGETINLRGQSVNFYELFGIEKGGSDFELNKERCT